MNSKKLLFFCQKGAGRHIDRYLIRNARYITNSFQQKLKRYTVDLCVKLIWWLYIFHQTNKILKKLELI